MKNKNDVINEYKKYVNIYEITPEQIIEKVLHPDYEEIMEKEWTVIIDEIYKLAHQKAYQDNVVTPEELNNLRLIKKLGGEMRNAGYKVQLQAKLNQYMKSLSNEEQEPQPQKIYNPKYKYPKPSPYNWYD